MLEIIQKVLVNKGYIVEHVRCPSPSRWRITRPDDSVWKLECRNLQGAYRMINKLTK